MQDRQSARPVTFRAVHDVPRRGSAEDAAERLIKDARDGAVTDLHATWPSGRMNTAAPALRQVFSTVVANRVHPDLLPTMNG